MIAEGTYTGTGSDPVVTIDKDLILSGGWNAAFTSQNGNTVIDGQKARQGIRVLVSSTSIISNVTVQNGSIIRGEVS